MTKLPGLMRRTIETHHLIEKGDGVAVGLSGGKDSMALVYFLKSLSTFTDKPFRLEAITIDLGFNNFDLDAAKNFCADLEVPYTIVPTEIAKVVFEIRDEKNPCALCANMRRGALAETMKAKGLNKLALGHHADDALSTLFLNMLYSGKLNTLEYQSHLSRSGIDVIRPFLDVSESQIIGAINKLNIPVLKSPCPMDKHTKREDVQQFLKGVYKEIPNSRRNLLTAMRNEDQCNLFKKIVEPL